MIFLLIYLISVLIFYIIFSIVGFNFEKQNITDFKDAFSMFCFCFLISFGWIIVLPLALITKYTSLRKE